jgi:hypothetical protein
VILGRNLKETKPRALDLYAPRHVSPSRRHELYFLKNGSETGMTRWQRLARWIGRLGLLLMLAVAGCGKEEPSESPVKVEDFRYQELPGGTRIVTGVVRNLTDQPIANLQLEIGLYDRHNRLIGTMQVPVQDVPPKGRKRFRQPLDTDQDVHGARVRSVLVL